MLEKLKDIDKTIFLKFLQIMKVVNSSLDLEEVLNNLMDVAIEMSGAERGFIMLVNEEGKLEVKTARNINKETIESEKFNISASVINKVYKEKRPIISSDAATEFNKSKSIRMFGIRSILSTPIMHANNIIGIIYLDSRITKRIFTKEHEELLSAIADQSSIAINNAKLYNQLQQSYIEAVSALTKAIEAKDKYTRGHSERVAYYSVLIGKALGFNSERLFNLRLAGVLHDIGKIGITEKVLLKPSRLNDEEYDLIKKHPELGYEILSPLNIEKEVKEGVLYHQERWDGKGYPEGLKGNQIPIFAQIISVADTYDAMTSDRAYRKAFPKEYALKEIKKSAGTQLSPKIAEIFVKIMQNR